MGTLPRWCVARGGAIRCCRCRESSRPRPGRVARGSDSMLSMQGVFKTKAGARRTRERFNVVDAGSLQDQGRGASHAGAIQCCRCRESSRPRPGRVARGSDSMLSMQGVFKTKAGARRTRERFNVVDAGSLQDQGRGASHAGAIQCCRCRESSRPRPGRVARGSDSMSHMNTFEQFVFSCGISERNSASNSAQPMHLPAEMPKQTGGPAVAMSHIDANW